MQRRKILFKNHRKFERTSILKGFSEISQDSVNDLMEDGKTKPDDMIRNISYKMYPESPKLFLKLDETILTAWLLQGFKDDVLYMVFHSLPRKEKRWKFYHRSYHIPHTLN